jgi:hypothetical protein
MWCREGTAVVRLAVQSCPAHHLTVMPKGHGQQVEVSQDRAQGAQPLNSQDDIETIQRQGIEVGTEMLCADFKVSCAAHPATGYLLTVGHLHC